MGFFLKQTGVCSQWFAQPNLTALSLEPALSYCLLLDSVFIAETNQQAFDDQGEGYFKAIRHK